MKTLLTDRLIIRRMSTADAEFMLALLNEPSWLRYIGDRGVRTLEDAKAYIQHGPMMMYESHGYGFCIVQSKESAHPLGICGLAKRDYLNAPDLGFAISPQHWGQGIAHEAATAVLSYAKGGLGLRRVLATTRTDNTASQRLLARLKFELEGIIRHPDGDRDLNLYAMQEQDHAEAHAV